MVYANTATLPVPEEVLELMKAHYDLLEKYGEIAPGEEDTFSLAQPSPLKFVPSIASGDVPVPSAGD